MRKIYFQKITAIEPAPPAPPTVLGIDLTTLIQSKSEFADRPRIIRMVLVVDDDPTIGRTVRRSLNGWAEVHTTEKAGENSEECKKLGLEMVRAKQYDCIYIDGLYGLGPELAKELRAGGFTGWIVSFSSEPEMQREIIDNGGDWVVSKPYEVEIFWDPSKITDAVSVADNLRTHT